VSDAEQESVTEDAGQDGETSGGETPDVGPAAMMARAAVAEDLLVPDHLDRADDVHLLSDDEREDAFEQARAGTEPSRDLRALVARRREERGEPAPGPEAEPAAPAAAKTLGGGDAAPEESESEPEPAPKPAAKKTLGLGDGEPDAEQGADAPPEADPAEAAPAEAPPAEAAASANDPAPELPPAVPLPAPGPEASPPAPVSVATRIIGVCYLVVAAVFVYSFSVDALGSQLATESRLTRLVIQAAAVLLPGYPGLLGLWALVQGSRPPESANVLGLPFEGWWFRTLGTMARREAAGILARPVAYVALFFFLLTNGYLFAVLLAVYGGDNVGQSFQVPVTFYLTSNPMLWITLILICPALTMRLLAEEAKSGTLEMLLTAPVTDVQVVLSKYLGAISCYVVMLLSMVGYLAILRGYASDTGWDWGPILGAYLSIFLVGAHFLAIGLFASSITRTQFVAFMLALIPILGLFFIRLAEYFVESQGGKEMLRHFDIYSLHEDMARGLVYSRTVILHLSGILLFLFLAVRGVESHKWR
jgi:gliding motility-associated transport system permease protein